MISKTFQEAAVKKAITANISIHKKGLRSHMLAVLPTVCVTERACCWQLVLLHTDDKQLKQENPRDGSSLRATVYGVG